MTRESCVSSRHRLGQCSTLRTLNVAHHTHDVPTVLLKSAHLAARPCESSHVRSQDTSPSIRRQKRDARGRWAAPVQHPPFPLVVSSSPSSSGFTVNFLERRGSYIARSAYRTHSRVRSSFQFEIVRNLTRVVFMLPCCILAWSSAPPLLYGTSTRVERIW
jgi:hypothetical protein